jgi:hypothetical protein
MNILPYFYHLVNNKTNQFYFGYRCKNKVQAKMDLGYHYFTSNKFINKNNFSEWRIEEIIEFECKYTAYDYEQKLISLHKGNPLMINKHHIVNGNSRFINLKGAIHKKRKERLDLIDVNHLFNLFTVHKVGFTKLKRDYGIIRQDAIYLFNLYGLPYKQFTENNRKFSISESPIRKANPKDFDDVKNLIIVDGLSLCKIYELGYLPTIVKHTIKIFSLEDTVAANRKKWSRTAASIKLNNLGGSRKDRAREIIISSIDDIKKMISLGLNFKDIVLRLDADVGIYKEDIIVNLSEKYKTKLYQNWRSSCRKGKSLNTSVQ